MKDRFAAGRTGTGLTAFGPSSDAMELDFQCVRTHWIPGFMGFQLDGGAG